MKWLGSIPQQALLGGLTLYSISAYLSWGLVSWSTHVIFVGQLNSLTQNRVPISDTSTSRCLAFTENSCSLPNKHCPKAIAALPRNLRNHRFYCRGRFMEITKLHAAWVYCDPIAFWWSKRMSKPAQPLSQSSERITEIHSIHRLENQARLS